MSNTSITNGTNNGNDNGNVNGKDSSVMTTNHHQSATPIGDAVVVDTNEPEERKESCSGIPSSANVTTTTTKNNGNHAKRKKDGIASKFERNVLLVHEMRKDFQSRGCIQNRRWHLKKYADCFLHEHVIDWIVQNGDKYILNDNISIRILQVEIAVWKANELVDAGYIHHVKKEHCFCVNENRTLFFRFNDQAIDAVTNVIQNNNRQSSSTAVLSSSNIAFHNGMVRNTSNDTKSSAADRDSYHQEQAKQDEKFLATLMLASEMREGLHSKIKHRRWRLRVYQNCVLSGDIIHWLMRKSQSQSNDDTQSSVTTISSASSIHDGDYGASNDISTNRNDNMDKDSKEEEAEAVRMANKMINAGYIGHVLQAHRFVVGESRTLFFRLYDLRIDADLAVWCTNSPMESATLYPKGFGRLARIARRSSIETTEESSHIAELLSQYPWSALGQGDLFSPTENSFDATSSGRVNVSLGTSASKMEMMVMHITAILERRLVALLLKRARLVREHQSSSSKSLCALRKLSLNSASSNDGASVSTEEHGYAVDDQIRAQLRLFVIRIAELYQDVHYHSFEHAHHVVVSLNNMLELLISKASTANDHTGNKSTHSSSSCCPLQPSYGLGNDPFCHLAAIFAALVHDVGHMGVKNVQLVEEGNHLASVYHEESVAEKHSLKIAFNIFKRREFSDLRESMFENVAEDYGRFRLIMIDLVLCTDIASTGRIRLTKGRWDRAFGTSENDLDCEQAKVQRQQEDFPFHAKNANSANCKESSEDLFNVVEHEMNELRLSIIMELAANGSTVELYSTASTDTEEMKASVTLETMIHAADVGANMQGWDTFIKWGSRLFNEDMTSFKAGRGQDPSTTWNKGQIGFLSGYVAPLAKKLITCGVFGDDGAIFLENVEENRRRWLVEGDAITAQLIAQYNDDTSDV